MTEKYLHGFDAIEQARLVSQAKVLDAKIFEKINFEQPTSLLEVGCGVGAQTEILINRFPNTKITGIELSSEQFTTAQNYLNSKFNSTPFELYQMDARKMSFADNSFDAIYICWVLEHIENPSLVLEECYRVLKPNGIIYITEVQNNHLHLEPYSPFLVEYWHKYNQLQMQFKGDPYVGVKLNYLLDGAGFNDIELYPQQMLHDNTDKEGREKMTNYWTELMLSGFNNLLENSLVKEEDREMLKSEMSKVKSLSNGVFSYAFMQGKGRKN